MSKEEVKTIQSLRFLSIDTTIEMQMTASGVRGEHPFVALVTYAGRSSDKPVGGTELIEGGPYRVFIPTDLMRKKIRELEGCSTFAECNLDTHAKTKPVGEFTSAWVEPADTPDGRLVLAARASGLLSHNRHPEIVDEIVAEAREGKLGFSYDIKDIHFTLEAHEVFPEMKTVKIIDFKWRGATILKRKVAAYSFTELAAREKEVKASVSLDRIREVASASVATGFNKSPKEVNVMNENELKQMQTAIAEAVKVAVEPIETQVTELGTKVDGVVTAQAELKAKAEESKSGEESNSDAPKEKNSEPKVIGTVNELVKGIGEQFKAALAPLSEKLDKVVTKEPEAKSEGDAEGDDATKNKDGKAPEANAEAAKDAPKGQRKSHDSSTLMLLARFTDEQFMDGSDDVTADQLRAACKNIEKDKDMSKAEKDQAISSLSFQRRQLLRQEWRKNLN